jgi:P-type Cu2+ transporter
MLQAPTQKQVYLSNSLETVTLDIQGMKCAGCVSAVERQLKQNVGVISACVNLITEVAVVEYEKETVTPEQLAQKLTKTGFPSEPRLSFNSSFNHKLTPFQRREKEQKEQINRLITAIVLLLFSGLGHLQHLGMNPIPLISNIWFHWALATLALAIPGFPILREGWQGLYHKMPNMNTLVGLGTVSAYLASGIALLFPALGWECFFDEPVMLLGFILFGRILESRARGKASKALEELLSLQPSVACLVGKEATEMGINIPVEQIRIGEWIKVLPGEKIPVDGMVIQGKSTVNEAMLTGEATPVLKWENEQVKAGTINQNGLLIIQTTHTGDRTTLAQIIKLVESAQNRKAPIQKLADTVAGYFAYGVMAIASLTFLFWYYFGTKIWSEVLTISPHHGEVINDLSMEMTTSPLLLSLKLAIAVLVVACPCALGLATPTAILVGTGIGAQKGILIKGGDILEQVHKLDTIVFDKTGTLTQGHPTITKIVPVDDLSSQEILQWSATAETGANHPLAIALLNALEKEKLPLLKGENFQTSGGLGISAVIEGKSVILGNEEWLKENQINLQTLQEKNQGILGHQTLVYLGINGKLKGIIALEDKIRDDGVKTVKKLQEMGLKVIMMSGDRLEVAQGIAKKLGITEVLAQVSPKEKATKIKQLQEQLKLKGKIIAMVGDGINDAPALAQADLGIALQSGTAIAMESAHIVLMKNSLWDVVESIKLSLATLSKIRQNLFWALGYNALAIPVACGILLPKFGLLLSPAFAAALMAISSVIVVTNSLLLRHLQS